MAFIISGEPKGFPVEVGIRYGRRAVHSHRPSRRSSASTLPAGDQVVEDEVGMALPDPAGLIFAAAVLKIKHRVTRLGLRVIARRRVDQGMTPASR